MGALAACRPGRRALHRLGHLSLGGRPGRTLIEAHDEVGPQGLLLRHRPLRAEHVLRAVVDGAEGHPAVVDLCRVAQAEHLVAAAVGEDGPVPLHERVQAAKTPHRVAPGPQRQVVRVGQDDLSAEAFSRSGVIALTVPLVPTGMKQGVRTRPRGVSRQARPGVAVARLDGEREIR